MRMASAGAVASAFALDFDARAAVPPRFRAIAFDAFPILDPRPIAALAENLFPGRGAALMEAWRTRQFESCWLRSVSHHYVDFWKVTEDALVFAASALDLRLEASTRQRVMDAYLDLRTSPDVVPALTACTRPACRARVPVEFHAGHARSFPMKTAASRRCSPQCSSPTGPVSPSPIRAHTRSLLSAFRLPRRGDDFRTITQWERGRRPVVRVSDRFVGEPRSRGFRRGSGVSADASGADSASLVRYVLPADGRW